MRQNTSPTPVNRSIVALRSGVATWGAVCLGLAALSAASSAHAEAFYAGGALTAPAYNDPINGYGEDSGGHGPGYKLYGGYQFTPNVAVEAGVMNLGRTRDTGGSATLYGGFVDAVGTLPLAPQWSLLGRVGVAQARLSTSGQDEQDTALKLGAGLQYEVNQTMAVRMEYEHYRFSSAFGSKPEVGQISVGLKIGF